MKMTRPQNTVLFKPGTPMPPGFDRFKNFGHNELTAKHCYFKRSRPPDVDGINIFDKLTRPQNIKILIDILIYKNQTLQILYLKHCAYKTI